MSHGRPRKLTSPGLDQLGSRYWLKPLKRDRDLDEKQERAREMKRSIGRRVKTSQIKRKVPITLAPGFQSETDHGD